MKRNLIGFVLLAMALGANAFAKTNIMRGGVGFLYPDHNSFQNPGQLAMSHGTGLEILYGYQQGASTATQTGSLSMSFAAKKYSLAVGASRTGTALESSNSSTDSVNLGAGVALGKRVTVGGHYARSIDGGQTNDGTIRGTVTLNPGRSGRGLAIGAAYSTTVGGLVTHGAKIAFGFTGKKKGSNFEASFELPNLSSTSSFKAGAAFTLSGKSVYLGAGYTYDNSAATANHDIAGRVGFLLSKKGSADLSAFVTYTTETNVNPSFGGTFRALF